MLKVTAEREAAGYFLSGNNVKRAQLFESGFVICESLQLIRENRDSNASLVSRVEQVDLKRSRRKAIEIERNKPKLNILYRIKAQIQQ